MSTLSDPPFAHSIYACKWEKQKSASYCCDNSDPVHKKHRFVVVQQTLEGCGRFRYQGREFVVPAGSALVALIPEKSTYFFREDDSPEWVFRWIDFEGESSMQLWGALRNRFGPVLPLRTESGAGHALGRLIENVADRRFSGVQALAEAVHSVFLGCWFELEGGEAGPLNAAARLRELIREKYHQGVNIKQLCAEAGQSREHLSRHFKKIYGIEPGAYLHQLRLNAVERFLLRSNLSICDIARRTGYAGPTQLTRNFVAAKGKSPRAFRNREF